MSIPADVQDLVERFDRNVADYKRGKYNETQVRREFIDPFFKALGWDVDNTKGYAEAYKEVVHEDAIKVGRATKAPDYSFRIGGFRKFFLEAKKPSVDIKHDTHPAYQLRRYAWSAKLPLSILTDFEEFAVYDCRIKPVKTDKAPTARVMYLTYQDYLEQWPDLVDIFSPESIRLGSFDKYIEAKKAKKGTAEVDNAFLQEIERWRDLLACNFALRNSLSQRQLNFAVQQTIDRLIFLRIAEDRGIERYGRLQELLEADNLYPRLFKLFQQADEKYNSGLFHFQPEKGRDNPDTLTPALTLDDKVLKDILRHLYYPDSPYEFSVLPGDILGQVYEQFLGKVIRLTPKGQAKIEDKPEVKKAGGVFYTPTYIVDYIVQQTVGQLVEGKTPGQLRGKNPLRVLDPACGSGSFLLGAYQFLLDWYLEWYTGNDPAKQAKKKDAPIYPAATTDPNIPNWRLTIDERKQILLTHIFGVDIDPQAVEVTKLSLLLKVLEDEQGITKQLGLFQERVLPDLDQNIKCGNALIGYDFYDGQQMGLGLFDEEEQYRINAFDWETEFPQVFAALTPNPSPKGRGEQPLPLSPSGRGAGGEGLTGSKGLTSGKGDTGFDAVIGNPPYGMVTDENNKQYFLTKFKTVEGRFDAYELFIEQGIKLCKENRPLGFIVPNPLLSNLYTRKLRKYILNNCSIQEITNFGMDVFTDPTIHTCIIIIRRGQKKNNFVQIKKQVNSISDLDGQYDYKLPQSELGNNKNINFDVFIDPITRKILDKLSSKSEPLGEICFIRQCIKTGNDKVYVQSANSHPGDPWKPTLRGRSMDRYKVIDTNLYLKYGPWLARNWKNKSFYETPKIVIRETGKRISATIDLENRYILSSLYAVYPKATDESLSLNYILGIINSLLATFFMRIIALELTKGAFTKVRTNQLARLPICTINFSDPTDKAKHDKMVSLVEQMLNLHHQLNQPQTPQGKTMLHRQIEATDRQIDKLVYQLYNLSEEEINIVEGRE